MAIERYSALRDTLGTELFDSIVQSSILVVGAGGIGCELIKNLVMCGFVRLEVIDLDTIDVSNLNRQFLFRPHHVGKSKAEVARAAAMGFNPNATITAHHDNVKSSKFGPDYFKSFHLKALCGGEHDSLCLAGAIRVHLFYQLVTRVCEKTPSPQDGTNGYLGQTTVIKCGQTECYECVPKSTEKVYPICTIRSTPDKPVHCVVYAKEAFKLLFGNISESMLFEDATVESKSAYMDKLIWTGATLPDTINSSTALQYAESIMQGLFRDDVASKIVLGVYKGASSTPTPLSAENLRAGIEQARACLNDDSQRPSFVKGWERRVWDSSECVCEFALCMVEMWTEPPKRCNIGRYLFDKDDKLGMRFVCAASNLRAYAFHIPAQTYHDCKGVAGNIVPAIATTNAIVAGLQVLEAFKILRGNAEVKDVCKYTYCLRLPNRKGQYLQPSRIDPPSSSCFICSTAQLGVHIDTKTNTLGQFVTNVLKKRLGFNEPSIMKGTSVLYEEGLDADEDLHENLRKVLEELPAGGIRDGVMISVQDFSQELNVHITVVHCDQFDEETEPEGFRVTGGSCATQRPLASMHQEAVTESQRDIAGEDGDDFMVVLGSAKEGESPPVDVTSTKRPRSASNGQEHSLHSVKKARTTEQDVICVD